MCIFIFCTLNFNGPRLCSGGLTSYFHLVHLAVSSFIKRIDKGHCVIGFRPNLDLQEYKFQIRNKNASSYTFSMDKVVFRYSYWMLKTNPYKEILAVKHRHMEETGFMQTLNTQNSVPLKPMEEDPLKPLELKHFYLVLIGNAAGLSLAGIILLLEFQIFHVSERCLYPGI